jgi:hypothetical protein
MARKLKTYQTSLGFFDLAIAAPSMKAALDAWGDFQNPFFLLLSKVTFRYGNRDRFLGSFMIGSRSSLPSAKVFSRKRSSPSCTTSILIGFFAMGHKIRVSDGLDENKKAPNLSGPRLLCKGTSALRGRSLFVDALTKRNVV